jgi:hypothetical protein
MPVISSAGQSSDSRTINAILKGFSAPTPTFAGEQPSQNTTEEKLFEALASFKIFTSQIAMHLEDGWRQKLFGHLDNLLAVEEWDVRDLPPSIASFATFLRLLLLIKPEVAPGLGASSDGRIVGAWTKGDDRLTIECLPKDRIRWSVTIIDDEGEHERGAAETPIIRFSEVIAPYRPARWFSRA